MFLTQKMQEKRSSSRERWVCYQQLKWTTLSFLIRAIFGSDWSPLLFISL